MVAVSVGFFAVADNLWTMVAFKVWHSLGQAFCGIPMSAIGPDQVPVHQRGRLVALGGLINGLWGMVVGTASGVYIGQLCSKNDAQGKAIGIAEECPLTSLYIISLALNAICIPLGLMALGSRPGCCTPEIEVSSEQTEALPPGGSLCRRWFLAVQGLAKSFFEPFSFQPFRMWFISQFFTSISDIMWGQFQGFWFNNLIAPHTVFFGHHLTAIAAGEIGGLVSGIGGMVTLPFGAVLTDRCERKWVYATIVMINCQGPLIMAWNCSPDNIDYTMLLLSQCFAGAMGGFCNPSEGALEMDILPQDKQGRVLHATRDQQIKGYAGFFAIADPTAVAGQDAVALAIWEQG